MTKKFKIHEGYFAPVPKALPNPNLQTKLIRCYRCKELFVSSTTTNSTTRCPHCRVKVTLSNPNYYMNVEGMTQLDANKLNNSRSLMHVYVQKKLKNRPKR